MTTLQEDLDEIHKAIKEVVKTATKTFRINSFVKWFGSVLLGITKLFKKRKTNNYGKNNKRRDI
jgi:hypothetical protein